MDKIDFNETYEIYKICSNELIQDEESGRKILVNVLNNRQKLDKSLDNILSDLIESAGFYPYLEKENLLLTSTSNNIRKEFHSSKYLNNKYFHEDQKYLLDLLSTDQNVIVSAPTSFGKSLLIEEIVASKRFHNIVIIQPTLALLDETRKKLLKYKEEYKLIVRTSQEYSDEKRNIFLFTAERVNEYPEFPIIDFLIIDEFYKLSAKRDDERADSLNNAFYFLLNEFKCKFYLLGPNIDEISDGFIDKYNAIFYKTKFSLVDNRTIDIYSPNKELFDRPRKHKYFKEEKLFELLIDLQEEQSIIYCSSPARVRALAKSFMSFLIEKGIDLKVKNLPIIEWIKKNVSDKWSLIDLLEHRIGIHDGALQKHITSSIIDYFNDNRLQYLFCTTTIIEGVNTSAKNIIYFDNTKGNKVPIDFFDYSNIKGRAGRMMVHYVGKVYNFNPTPPDNQIIIDIPFYEQNPISPEVLINLHPDEIINKDSTNYKMINSFPENERSLFKKNGIQIFGQKNILDIMREEINHNYSLISWTGFPKTDQLKYVLNLAYNHLLKEGEATKSIDALVTVTLIYAKHKNIWALVDSTYNYLKKSTKYSNVSDNEILDEAIRDSFQTLKHWFQYKIPKMLSVMNELQKYVCHERGLRAGNYLYYANLIENDFIRDNLTILAEYGIPNSAIKKLETMIPSDMNQDDVIREIFLNKYHTNAIFLDYEKLKIEENL